MNPIVKNGDQLVQWFLDSAAFLRAEVTWQKGVYVTTRVRQEVLTSDRQGKVILKGSVRTISFENRGGGVYRAYLEAAEQKGGTDGT